jgi:hypothetical protein
MSHLPKLRNPLENRDLHPKSRLRKLKRGMNEQTSEEHGEAGGYFNPSHDSIGGKSIRGGNRRMAERNRSAALRSPTGGRSS